MMRPPPRSTRTDTLFPYTTLFRADGLGQRLHDLVLARGAVIDPVQALAPPLQADAADHRLAHHLRRLGHLMVEGIEREEVLALGFRRKEARQVAVAVVPLDQGAAGRQPAHPVLRPPRPFPAPAPTHSGPDSSRRGKVKSAEPHKTARREGASLRGEWNWLRTLLLCAMLSSKDSVWQP